MNKLTILCSIDGWRTTRTVNMVQTTSSSKIYDENVTKFDELPEQLDCFYITVNAKNLDDAVTLTDEKLNGLSEKLRNEFGDYDIFQFNSYPALCPENIEESIECKNLSLEAIVEKSKLLQQIKEAKAL